MDEQSLQTALRGLLSEANRQSQLYEIERQAYRVIARHQKIALQIGRLKIDAARVSLEARRRNKPE